MGVSPSTYLLIGSHEVFQHKALLQFVSENIPKCQKNFVQRLEYPFQALNMLIAEYLLRMVRPTSNNTRFETLLLLYKPHYIYTVG